MDYFFHDFSTLQLIVLMIAALLIGINKTGLPGLGLLPVVMLANTFPVGLSTGIQLGMLALADLPAAWYYRKTVNWKQLIRLIPMALVGIGCGTLVLRLVPDRSLKLLIAVVILTLCIFGLLKDFIFKDKKFFASFNETEVRSKAQEYQRFYDKASLRQTIKGIADFLL